MAQRARLHLLHTATGRIWLSPPPCIVHCVPERASPCRASVTCLGFSSLETRAKLVAYSLVALFVAPSFPWRILPPVGGEGLVMGRDAKSYWSRDFHRFHTDPVWAHHCIAILWIVLLFLFNSKIVLSSVWLPFPCSQLSLCHVSLQPDLNLFILLFSWLRPFPQSS